MQPSRRSSLGILFIAVGWLSAPTASAHIDLLEPEARAHGTSARGDPDIDVNSNLKSGPCGQVTSGRTTRVATYAPGQTLTVRVREENAHVSYLRVSIDLDGEEFPIRSQVPSGPETQEQATAAEVALGGDGLLAVVREDNDVAGFVHEIDVTLPDATCTNCTLQVIQFMYDDPAAPYYFQCADLVIADAGGSADAGVAPANGGGASLGGNGLGTTRPSNPEATGAPGSRASPPPAATSTTTGQAPAASGTTSAPAESSPATPAAASAASAGGSCAFSRRAGQPLSAAPLLVVFGLAALRRRSRAHSSR